MVSRKWLIAALLMCGLAAACSDYNTNLSIQTSTSILSFISPSAATVGAQGFTITANGAGFVSGALILWNGVALTTTLVSNTQVTAPVPASDLTTPGTAQVSVQIPGSAQSATQNVYNTTTTEISNVVLFTIGAAAGPSPAITSISAATTSAASTPFCSAQGFTLTVNGTNFTNDAVINWNGARQATTFVSATQLTAAIPASLPASAGTVAVTVTNSIGSSSSLPFTLSTPATPLVAPTITSLSQTSAAAGSSALTLTVTGTNILPCSVLQWVNTGNVKSTLPTTFVSTTQLTAVVPPADFLTIGNNQVVIFTPTPGGGTSAAIQFSVLPPFITSLTSSTTQSNATPSCTTTGFTLTVNGTNFVNGSVVNWNNSPRATTFVSATQLTAAISVADIAAAGAASVTVSNSGVASAPAPFTVSASSLPVPAITSLAPGGATAGGSTFSLSVTGSNFLPCSVVQWNGAARVTTYLSATQVQASILATDIASAATISVTVFNPAPAGGTSNALSFAVVAPTITSLSASTTSLPSTPFCGPAGLTLTVNGTNFVNGLVVNWNGSPRPTTFVSATQLTAAITAADAAFPGTAAITVSNATTTSNSATFSMTTPATNLPAPAIASLSPSSQGVQSAGSKITVDVTGTNLLPCSAVNLTAGATTTPLTTTFISSTGITAPVPVDTLGTFQVTVVTPAPGGGTSSALPFTVFTPVPGARVTAAVLSSNSSAQTQTGPGALSLPLMSADQRYAVFVVASQDGVTEIPGTAQNIFVRDTCAGVPSGCTSSVTLASIGLSSNPADRDSIAPSISADGRYVAFLSSARNLVDSDTNGATDVFVRDTCAGAPSGCTPSTQRVSVATSGMQANGASSAATISSTGRYVTFESAATNLGATSSSTTGLFLRDTCAGAGTGCVPSTQSLQ
jgi:trimeric autotransporter adhesin